MNQIKFSHHSTLGITGRMHFRDIILRDISCYILTIAKHYNSAGQAYRVASTTLSNCSIVMVAGTEDKEVYTSDSRGMIPSTPYQFENKTQLTDSITSIANSPRLTQASESRLLAHVIHTCTASTTWIYSTRCCKKVKQFKKQCYRTFYEYNGQLAYSFLSKTAEDSKTMRNSSCNFAFQEILS